MYLYIWDLFFLIPNLFSLIADMLLSLKTSCRSSSSALLIGKGLFRSCVGLHWACNGPFRLGKRMRLGAGLDLALQAHVLVLSGKCWTSTTQTMAKHKTPTTLTHMVLGVIRHELSKLTLNIEIRPVLNTLKAISSCTPVCPE